MLEAVDLACQRGERTLFRGLAFTLGAGECLHVAGENGAGKTSLLRLICGLLVPAAGSVRWEGSDIRRLREEFWSTLAYVGHANGIKDELTALENVRFGNAIAGRDASVEHARAALATLGVAGQGERPARALSQGQRRRVALARLCGAQSARLWVLDEPFTALDVRGVAVLQELIAAQLARGGCVVFTTHQEVNLPASVRRLDLDLRSEGRA
jgi:heme exporter protein A